MQGKDFCKLVLNPDDFNRIDATWPNCDWDALSSKIQKEGTNVIPKLFEWGAVVSPKQSEK